MTKGVFFKGLYTNILNPMSINLLREDHSGKKVFNLKEAPPYSAIRNKVGYGFNLFNSLALSFRLVTARMTTVPGRRR